MEYRINKQERNALYGLPHTAQLLYFRAIKPFMDLKSCRVGDSKRRISHQSLKEELYVEPKPGRTTPDISPDQIRRAIKILEQAGIIDVQSDHHYLMMKCLLVTPAFSALNKVASRSPTYHATQENTQETEIPKQNNSPCDQSAIPKKEKVAIHLEDNNYYIFLLSAVDKFWQTYPWQTDKERVRHEFNSLAPDRELFKIIMTALQAQIEYKTKCESLGIWTPPWKNPANWIKYRCWENSIPKITLPEKKHEKTQRPYRQKEPTAVDVLFNSCGHSIEEQGNVIDINDYQRLDGQD